MIKQNPITGQVLPIHGGFTFWRHGVVPAGKEYILDVVDQVIQEYVDDLGGQAGITAAQNILLHNLKKMLTFMALVDEHLSLHGVLDDKGNVHPSLTAFYLAVVNNSQRIVRDLGLKRVSPAADNLAAYIKQKYSQGKDTGTPEIVPPRGCNEGGGQ